MNRSVHIKLRYFKKLKKTNENWFNGKVAFIFSYLMVEKSKQMSMQKLLISLLFFFFTMFLNSCSTEEKQYKIGFAQCCDDQWRTIMEDEMYRELSFHPNVAFEVRNADGNSKRQVQQIRDLMRQDLDLIIVAPNESEPLTDVIEEIYNKGIPVILIDRKTTSEAYTAYIGGDNYKVGNTAGHYLASKFNKKGSVLELQMPMTISPAIERNRGFRDALKEYPELNVAAVLETGWNKTEAQIKELLPPILEKQPEVNIIFGHSDLIAEQAYRAVAKKGRVEDIFFVGVDGIPGNGRGVEAVEDGILGASLLYPTGGEKSIEIAMAILNKTPYDKKTLLNTVVIDRSNATILNQQFAQINNLQGDIDQQKDLFEQLESSYFNQRQLLFFLIFTLLLSLILGLGLWRSLRSKQKINQNLAAKNKEVTEKQERLIEMSAEINRVTKAKVNFFTNISHEFRTPLTLILAFVEDVLTTKRLNTKVRKSIELVNENAYRLLRLVNQVMDFRKIESEKMEVKASEQDMLTFVKNVMKSFEPIAIQRNIDFKLITRLQQLSLWFDMSMLDKVLFNLLSNAFKHTENGGKVEIIITKNEGEQLAIIMVEDNGKGMDEETTEHIFEPFYQAENEVNRENQGTGLGLSLSKSLMKLHNGDVFCKSAKNTGSQFIITMPLGYEHFDINYLVSENKKFVHQEYLFRSDTTISATDLTNKNLTAIDQKILIIEDNQDLQLFLSQKISTFYKINQAIDGQDGIRLAFEIIPDLIICDVNLPSKDGFEITQILKNDIRTSHIPIILLTAKNTIEERIEGTKAGADAYISKPFNVQFLLEQIKNLLFNRQILKETYRSDLIIVQTKKTGLSSIDQIFIDNLTHYIKENYTRQNFQVTDLCDELQLSRSQLYRKTKALLGTSISDHIQNIRLQKAQELLKDHSKSIADVAYEVGYTSPDYFSTVFKAKYNLTPSQFRK
jgi:signal transduction histidine kinase/DNA-binding response OmpR family regulator